MSKQELLNRLEPEARDIFDQARQLALARGGILSPVHLLVALLEALLPARRNSKTAAGDLLDAARLVLAERHPCPAEAITVPKDTQRIIEKSVAVGGSREQSQAAPIDLLAATLESEAVKPGLGVDFDPKAVLSDLRQNDLRNSKLGSEPATGKAAALAGVLADYCTDLAQESLQASSPPFVGREREIVAVLETLCRKLKNNPMLIGKPGVGKSALVAAVGGQPGEGKGPQSPS